MCCKRRILSSKGYWMHDIPSSRIHTELVWKSLFRPWYVILCLHTFFSDQFPTHKLVQRIPWLACMSTFYVLQENNTVFRDATLQKGLQYFWGWKGVFWMKNLFSPKVQYTCVVINFKKTQYFPRSCSILEVFSSKTVQNTAKKVTLGISVSSNRLLNVWYSLIIKEAVFGFLVRFWINLVRKNASCLWLSNNLWAILGVEILLQVFTSLWFDRLICVKKKKKKKKKTFI